MCYKQEKHKRLSINLAEKLKDVPDFISDFFMRYKSPTTQNCNWGYIRDLLQWLIDNGFIQKEKIADITKEDLQKLTPEKIARYFTDLQQGITRKKNSLDSIKTKRNIFHVFWNYLVNRDYVSKNIIGDDSLKGKFKTESKEKVVVVPTNQQIEEFLENIDNEKSGSFTVARNIAVVKLILGSGIRSEELINLDLDDLHLYDKRPYIEILGKGNVQNKSEVFISSEAMYIMRDYLKQRRKFLGDGFDMEKAVFVSEQKRRLSKTAMTDFFDRYSHGSINPHMLRHWFGTKLYKDTKDIVLVQTQLRHKNLETTSKYYVHIDKEALANAVDKMRVS